MGDIGGDWLKNFASRAIWQAVFVTPRNNENSSGFTCTLIFGL